MASGNSKFAVVDLFAGPGGLAEGFSAVTAADGTKPFRIALSVEKDASAHSTLLLRSFLRQFEGAYPPEYYDFLNSGSQEPDWKALYPDHWKAAKNDALLLELGGEGTEAIIDKRLDMLKKEHGDHTIVIGGPPCQAYSLVGRARNQGTVGYIAEEDPKHFLYQQYIRILSRLKPAAFVMENVKGILSAAVNHTKIFEKIAADLSTAGDAAGYQLIALAPKKPVQTSMLDIEPHAQDFVIRSEDFGLPQARHRVIIVGIRRSYLTVAPRNSTAPNLLPKHNERVPVAAVLDGMPRLRSGLSKGDSQEDWHRAVAGAVAQVRKGSFSLPGDVRSPFRERLSECEAYFQSDSSNLPRMARRPAGIGSRCPRDLKSWLRDKNLGSLPNNETRGHMASDLSRYLFAAIFAEVLGMSPKAENFPAPLKPEHANWESGSFADRFRVQLRNQPSTTITSHISKDGHYFIHPDPTQCRALTVREAARLQTFPDNYLFKGNRTEQFTQVGNAVPPYLAKQIGQSVLRLLNGDKAI
jgi:DNA (cytosine-5)-methyltransferase 1